MKNKVVLDSCVFNTLFLQVHDHLDAVNLITELSQRNYQVLAPSLFLYEVLTFAGWSQFSLNKAHQLIMQYQLANFELIEMDYDSIEKAIEICEAGHKKSGFPSFYDSSYHALANLNDCQFISADKSHISKTHKFVHTILLRDWNNIFST